MGKRIKKIFCIILIIVVSVGLIIFGCLFIVDKAEKDLVVKSTEAFKKVVDSKQSDINKFNKTRDKFIKYQADIEDGIVDNLDIIYKVVNTWDENFDGDVLVATRDVEKFHEELVLYGTYDELKKTKNSLDGCIKDIEDLCKETVFKEDKEIASMQDQLKKMYSCYIDSYDMTSEKFGEDIEGFRMKLKRLQSDFDTSLTRWDRVIPEYRYLPEEYRNTPNDVVAWYIEYTK